jgi:hypothetical protein
VVEQCLLLAQSIERSNRSVPESKSLSSFTQGSVGITYQFSTTTDIAFLRIDCKFEILKLGILEVASKSWYERVLSLNEQTIAPLPRKPTYAQKTPAIAGITLSTSEKELARRISYIVALNNLIERWNAWLADTTYVVAIASNGANGFDETLATDYLSALYWLNGLPLPDTDPVTSHTMALIDEFENPQIRLVRKVSASEYFRLENVTTTTTSIGGAIIEAIALGISDPASSQSEPYAPSSVLEEIQNLASGYGSSPPNFNNEPDNKAEPPQPSLPDC